MTSKNTVEMQNRYLSEINELEPLNFKLESTTVWSFKERGNWATHKNNYRGNFSPYIPRNIIQRYSHEEDIILDQFVGSGTTLVEAKLLRRKGIGIDINSDAIQITRQQLTFHKPNSIEPTLLLGDARNLQNIIDNESIDLICTHPPYANIIKYSNGIDGDLSLLPHTNFINEINKVASENFRVLKRNKYCAVLIGYSKKSIANNFLLIALNYFFFRNR